MNIYKKIANRYLKQSSQVTFKMTYEEDLKDHTFDSLHQIEAFSEGQSVGSFAGSLNLKDQEEFKKYTCYRDMWSLVAQNPSLVNSENKVYVVEVHSSLLEEDFQGQGLGVKGYLRLAQHLFQKKTNRTPFLFIPNYCHGVGSVTSPEAKRVWKSLARKYPSKGDVVLVNK
jgi:hypothetical protein